MATLTSSAPPARYDAVAQTLHWLVAVLIAVMFGLLLRSLRLAMFSMIPNFLPILVGLVIPYLLIGVIGAGKTITARCADEYAQAPEPWVQSSFTSSRSASTRPGHQLPRRLSLYAEAATCSNPHLS